MSKTTTKTNPHPVVTVDANNFALDLAILRALAESDDEADKELGLAGVTAFDAATEAGEPVESALGLAKLAMTTLRNGYA